MADFTTRTVTRQIYEVALPNPTVIAELDKAYTVARQNFKNIMGREQSYDDDIQVRATDEEIIFFFERDTK